MVTPKARKLVRSMNIVIGSGCLVFLTLAGIVGYSISRRKVDRRYKNPAVVMRTLMKAQRKFMVFDRDNDGRKQPAASLKALVAAKLISDGIASLDLHGYRYSLEGDGKGTWSIRGTPNADASSKTHYLATEDERMYASTGRPTTRGDRVLWSPKRRREF